MEKQALQEQTGQTKPAAKFLREAVKSVKDELGAACSALLKTSAGPTGRETRHEARGSFEDS